MKNRKATLALLIVIPIGIIVISALYYLSNLPKTINFRFNDVSYSVNVNKDWEVASDDQSLVIKDRDGYYFSIDLQPIPRGTNIMQRLIQADGYVEFPFDDENYLYIGRFSGTELYRSKHIVPHLDSESSFNNARLYVKKGDQLANLLLADDNSYRIQFLYGSPRNITGEEIQRNFPIQFIQFDSVVKSIHITEK